MWAEDKALHQDAGAVGNPVFERTLDVRRNSPGRLCTHWRSHIALGGLGIVGLDEVEMVGKERE